MVMKMKTLNSKEGSDAIIPVHLNWQAISELHEDHGYVLALRFYRDEGVIVGEPPDCGLVQIADHDFNSDEWDVFAEIDWNPAFELATTIDLNQQFKGIIGAVK